MYSHRIYQFTMIVLVLLFCFCNNILASNSNEEHSVDSINSDIEKILSEVETHYNGAGFEANFKQVVTLKQIGISDTAQGKFFVLKPGNIRWEYYEPYSQTIICTKNTIWLFNPIDNQVVITNLQSLIGKGLNLSFISDITMIRNNFFVSLEKNTASQNIHQLKLLPKIPSANLFEVYINISKENFDIIQVRTISLYGDETIIKFEDININSIPDHNIFKLDIPKDADILELNN